MAVPFYLPEAGADDNVSSTVGITSSSVSSSASSSSSDGASTSSQSAQSSPNTTTSATQTPMQSPLVPGEQLVMAFCEAFYRCSLQNGTPGVFQYPTPPSPSCSLHSPSYLNGDVFFPLSRNTPRTPRTSVSFAAGEEIGFFRQQQQQQQQQQHQAQQQHLHAQHQQQQQQQQQQQHQQQQQQNNNNSVGNSVTATTQTSCGSAPPMLTYSHYQPAQYHHHAAYVYPYQYTPPPTPTTIGCTAFTTTGTMAPKCTSTPNSHSAQRSQHIETARRSHLTSTGEDERENLSEHETSLDDDYDDRFDNFTAGRERLQEFNGRIPPRKKKKDIITKPKPEKKVQIFHWPTVVTVFVFAMGCGYFVAR